MKFVAFERQTQGTGASRRLRITGRTPAIVYGGGAEPKNIELDHNALWHALKNETFHSSILTMDLGGVESKVLLRDVQIHPYKPLVLHIDFQRVDANTRLHMKVPLHFFGDDQSPAVKNEGCIANHNFNEIDIVCLPGDLPEFIRVDLSGLTKGGALHLADIAMPKGVKAVVHGNDKNPVVVSVVAVGGAEAEAEAASAAAPAQAEKPAAKGKGKK